MFNLDDGNSLESQLLAQLAEVEKRIVELTAERETLQRLITKARHKNIHMKDVTRKNSFDRILIENSVLEILKESGTSVRTKKMLSVVQSVVYGLKDSTFRSHLHRMKEKGLIKPSYYHGSWDIVEK